MKHTVLVFVSEAMDQDNWLEEFRKRAAPRLRKVFENDLSTAPQELVERLEELRKKERGLLKGKRDE